MFSQEIPTITADEVDARLEDGWRLLDVRTDGEWQDGRIDGALHIPLDQVAERLDEIPDRVVCVCALGGRSSRATAYLVSQGRAAVNLDGGVQEWAAQGRPLVS